MLVLEYSDAYKPRGEGFITSVSMYIRVLSMYYLLLDFPWLKKKRTKKYVEKLSHNHPSF